MKERILIAVPIIFIVTLILFLFISNRWNHLINSNYMQHEIITNPTADLYKKTTTTTETDDTCSCSLKSTSSCSTTDEPVLGGVDLVQYFTDFKITSSSSVDSNGNPIITYNESKTGNKGYFQYHVNYNGYMFYFLSQENQNIFTTNPSAYIPQWGGFCAWGVSAEFCPTYGWSATCLGPSGNWAEWTIYKNKLYFFLDGTPKGYFLEDPDLYVQQGNERWYSWFGEESLSYYSTTCFVMSGVGAIKAIHKNNKIDFN